MADKHLCVAIYMTHDQADEAFSRLQAEGSDMGLLSFVGRDYWKDMVGSRNAGERFMYRGNLGPFWERLWSILRGWGVFWFFENGPVLVAGPWATNCRGRKGRLTTEMTASRVSMNSRQWLGGREAISPGEKELCVSHEPFDEQPAEQLRLNPGPA